MENLDSVWFRETIRGVSADAADQVPNSQTRLPSRRGRSRSACVVNGRLGHAGAGRAWADVLIVAATDYRAHLDDLTPARWPPQENSVPRRTSAWAPCAAPPTASGGMRWPRGGTRERRVTNRQASWWANERTKICAKNNQGRREDRGAGRRTVTDGERARRRAQRGCEGSHGVMLIMWLVWFVW